MKDFREIGKKTEEEERLTISGFPSPAADYSKMPLSLDKLIIRNPASTFFFRFSGDIVYSEADFQHNDILVIDRSLTINSKTKYVLVYNEEGFMLIRAKNFVKVNDNKENKYNKKSKSFNFFGVMIALVRTF
ncbi:MAG: hypothetical protein NZ522_02605 [Chitinophagales bacterium]|nr:hypothetical protein [Chitinophagales bacterium]